MRWRVLVVCAQVPVTFVSGALWAGGLNSALLDALIVVPLIFLMWALYGWVMSLAGWQYHAGVVEGLRVAEQLSDRKTMMDGT